ncbi:MAG: hypothetical protein ACRDZ5_04360 [Acidimicrobiales bacterium]
MPATTTSFRIRRVLPGGRSTVSDETIGVHREGASASEARVLVESYLPHISELTGAKSLGCMAAASAQPPSEQWPCHPPSSAYRGHHEHPESLALIVIELIGGGLGDARDHRMNRDRTSRPPFTAQPGSCLHHGRVPLILLMASPVEDEQLIRHRQQLSM